jgi:hypothetical protein
MSTISNQFPIARAAYKTSGGASKERSLVNSRIKRIGAVALLVTMPVVCFAPLPLPPVLSTQTTFADSDLTNIYSLISYNFSNDCFTVSSNGAGTNAAKIAVLQDIADLIACSTSLADSNTRSSYATITKSNVAYAIQLDGGPTPAANDPRVIDIYTNFARADLPLIRSVSIGCPSASASRPNPATNKVHVTVLCGHGDQTNLVSWIAATTVENVQPFIDTMTNLCAPGLSAGAVIDAFNTNKSAGTISDFRINVRSDIGTPVTRNAEAGKFPLVVINLGGQLLVIQATSDFKTWTDVWTNPPGFGVHTVNVPMLLTPATFYRLRLAP